MEINKQVQNRLNYSLELAEKQISLSENIITILVINTLVQIVSLGCYLYLNSI